MLRLTTSVRLILCAYVTIAAVCNGVNCDEVASPPPPPPDPPVLFDNNCQGDSCNVPFDPCSMVTCGENAMCKTDLGEPFCVCIPEFSGNPYKKCLKIECKFNADCPSNKTCAFQRCEDACTYLISCGQNANCSVVEHRPYCNCPHGYGGDPYELCTKSECSSNGDCRLGKTCFEGKCVNPCSKENTCGLNAVCQVRDHRHSCLCIRGYVGDPYQMCIVPECTSDNDCNSNRACTFSKCVDPCETMVLKCGDKADCLAVNHRPSCACHPGHSGNPYKGCTLGNSTTGKKPSTSSKNNRYHAETTFKTTWQGALEHCQGQGRRLATVQSWEDNNQVLQVIGQTNVRSSHFWTAGTDQYGHGWMWETTGRPFTFTYWDTLQPTNFIMRNEHCMGYWEISTILIGGYKWNDRDCGYKGYFICEDFTNIK